MGSEMCIRDRVGCQAHAPLVHDSSLAARDDDIFWEAADTISSKDAIWLLPPFLKDATSCSFKMPFTIPAVDKTVVLAPPALPPDPTPSSTVVISCSVPVEDLDVIDARMSFFPRFFSGRTTSVLPSRHWAVSHWFTVLCDQSFLIREDVSEPSPVPCQSSHDCPSSVCVRPSSVRLGLSHLIGSSLEPIDPSEANQTSHPRASSDDLPCSCPAHSVESGGRSQLVLSLLLSLLSLTIDYHRCC